MTGSHELCMLIDGVVKRFPTAIVHTDTPFYVGETKVLCMEDPVQEVIIGNISGALGLEQYRDTTYIWQNRLRSWISVTL